MCIAFDSLLTKSLLPAFLLLAAAGCSGDPMVPPGEVDGGAQVGSIEPLGRTMPVAGEIAADDLAYPSADQPVSDTSNNADYLNTPNLAGTGSDRQLPMIDEEPADPAPSLSASGDGSVNMDDALGVETNSLAEEESGQIAEGNASQPVVDGIGTDVPVEIQPGQRQSRTIGEAAGDITLPGPGKRTAEVGQQVAFIPRFSNPMSVPESFGGLSASDRNCRQELKKLGVDFTELEPIRDGGSCGIAHPIKVKGLAGGIDIKPAATLNCPVTLAFAKWVKKELVPSARMRYFSGIKTIRQLSSYSCRKMNSKSSNPWSEHAKGNAIDVGKFVLNSGKEIDVRKKSIFSFRERGLLKAVRSDSCKYFNTVLGPGSDANHKDHFHFDLRSRKSGRRYCDL